MTLLDKAIAAIPGVPEIDAAIKTLKHDLSHPPALAQRPPEGSDLADVLVAGGRIPDDLGEQHAEWHRRRDAAVHRADAVRGALKALENRRANVIRDGVDDGLLYLAALLPAVLDEGREVVARLGHVRSDRDAVDAGPAQLEAWVALGPVADRYGALRDAQWQLVKRAEIFEPGADNFQAYLHVSQWPNYAATRGTEQDPPWPHRQAGRDDHKINREYLIWLFASGVRPIIPTRQHMRALAQANARQATPAEAPQQIVHQRVTRERPAPASRAGLAVKA